MEKILVLESELSTLEMHVSLQFWIDRTRVAIDEVDLCTSPLTHTSKDINMVWHVGMWAWNVKR